MIGLMIYFGWRIFKILFLIAIVNVILASVPGGFIGERIIDLIEKAIRSADWSPFASLVKDLGILGVWFLFDSLSGRENFLMRIFDYLPGRNRLDDENEQQQ